MEIISRSAWGARYASAYRNYDAPLPADEVWLHHSVTIAPDLVPPFSDDYAAIRALEKIGQDRFGWGMSYTWPITPAGLIFQGHRGDGVGTHTGGRNSRARAICFVGNYENSKPTDAQIRAAAWLLQHAKRQGWIRSARLNGGHRDLKATACPGRHAYAAIAEINRLAAGPPITGSTPIEEDDMSAEDVQKIRDDIQSLRALVSGPNLTYKIDGEERTGSLRTVTAYTRQDVRAVLRAVQGLAKAIDADTLAAEVAEQINRLDAEDVVDALADRLTEGNPAS